ncbi:MAG: hypothetical protein HY926_06500, partial [Elusimicrobia bacterium]|nr:hypothetical protein [Elusimicrobiota bacterium]
LPAEAASWRLRAREHFETGTTNLADGRGSLSYAGLRSAFNLSHEKPWKRMVGLTVQRGSLRQAGTAERLTVTTLGLEGKLFPTEKARLWFVRAGLLAEASDPAGPPAAVWTYGLAAGTGLEFPVWRLGLAPELGGKSLWGPGGAKATSFIAAFGVHFYVFPGDPRSPRHQGADEK